MMFEFRSQISLMVHLLVFMMNIKNLNTLNHIRLPPMS